MSAGVLQGPKLKYCIEEKTLGAFFFNHAEKFSCRLCQLDGTIDEPQTYGFVKTKSVRMAVSMRNRGVTPNSVIAVCSANSLENTIPILAAFYLGAKVISFEPTSLEGTKDLLRLVAPKMIFVQETSLRLTEKSLVGAKFKHEIVVFGQSTKYSHYSHLIQEQKNEKSFKPAKVDPEDVIIMVFSSGIGGTPKIVCHSHRSFFSVVLQSYQASCNSNALHVTSFYWLSTYVIMTCCFKGGNCRIFSHRPSTETILQMIPYLFLAPFLTHKLINTSYYSNYDTSSVKVLVCAGAPMPSSLFQKMNNLFPNAAVSLIYAMAETGIISTFDFEADKDLIKTKWASSGKPASLVQIKIVDPETEESLGPNQRGEIRIKTPSLMVGYYRSGLSHILDDEGFLKSEDLGSYDEDECIYVFDKLKDVFTYRNTLIIPSVIEAALLEHPAIKETAVFGIPLNDEDEVPAACVVLKEGSVLKQEEIDLFLKERITDREMLRGGVTFLSDLPWTPTFKVVRQELRDLIVKSKMC